MDKREALQILGAVLERFGLESYEALKSRIGSAPVVEEHRGPSGRWYQIELLFLWDDRRDGNVRVMGSIDDGGWRAFAPVTRSFIKPPDGQSAGE